MRRVLSRPVSGFVWLTGVSRNMGHLEGREGATYLDTVHSAFFECIDPFLEGFFSMPTL